MSENSQIKVYLMREIANFNESSVSSSIVSSIKWILIVGTLIIALIVGIVLKFASGYIAMSIIFVFSAIIIYFIYKYTPNFVKSKKTIGDNILLGFIPVIRELNKLNFDAAAEHTRAIIRISSMIINTNPKIFSVFDESLRFYLVKLIQLAEVQKIIGDKRELQNQLKRIDDNINNYSFNNKKNINELKLELDDVQKRLDKFEIISKAAIEITTELAYLRSEGEKILIEKLSLDNEDQRSAFLLREQLEREKRVAQELVSLGLY